LEANAVAVDEALIQQHQILAMNEAEPFDVNHLRDFLESEEMGPFILKGHDALTWGWTTESGSKAACCPDLVALKPRQHGDAFTKWVSEKLIYALRLHRISRKPTLDGQNLIQRKTIRRVTDGITTIAASLLCVLSTIVLYYVPSVPTKLILIVVFNFIGSIFLFTFTSARKAEVFAVSAA